jgi:hypothetical protein
VLPSSGFATPVRAHAAASEWVEQWTTTADGASHRYYTNVHTHESVWEDEYHRRLAWTGGTPAVSAAAVEYHHVEPERTAAPAAAAPTPAGFDAVTALLAKHTAAVEEISAQTRQELRESELRHARMLEDALVRARGDWDSERRQIEEHHRTELAALVSKHAEYDPERA